MEKSLQMQEFKGGLHTSCLRPWPFKDKKLEKSFQDYMHKSVLDRTRSALIVVMSCAWTLRIVFLAVRLVFPYEWTRTELLLTSVRILMMTFCTSAICFELSGQTKVWFSRFVIWTTRFAPIVAFSEQAGVQQDDSTILFVPLMFTTMTGLLLPSFVEYVSYISILYLVKPAAIIVMGSNGCPRGISAPCPGKDFQTVFIQNICLFFTAIGVFYHVHSDTRRRWLLSFEVFGPLNIVFPASEIQLSSAGKGSKTDTEVAVIVWSDLQKDEYFPTNQREEQRELWQQERAEIDSRAQVAAAEPGGWKRLGGPLGGRTHRGADADSGERLALKTLPGGAAHAAFLLREAARARALAHPALVPVRGGAWRGGALWLATDYCGGGSVEALLRRAGRPLEPTLARWLGQQAGSGVAYLHRHGLLHGNLKPSNCLLVRARPGERGPALRLADYGPANRLLDLGDPRLRRFAAVAPEILRREGHGRPADVWAFGSAAREPVRGREGGRELWSEVASE